MFRNKSKTYITLLLTLVGFAGWAQLQEKGAYKVDYDTNYIRDYRHRLSLAVTSDFKNNNFFLLRQSESNLHYTSNLPKPMYGIMLTYRWLNFTGAIPINGLSSINSNYSKTDGFALAFGVTGRKLYFRNFYEDYTGFRLENPEDVNPQYYSQFSVNPDYKDFRQRTYMATVYYGFNGKKYSHRNILWQSETQLKSAGSVIAGLNGGYNWFTSSKNLLASKDFSLIQDATDLVDVEYFTMGLSLGYAYSLVLPYRLNLSLMLVPSLSYNNGKYTFRDHSYERFSNALGANGEARAQLTYNTKQFYGSATYIVYAVSNLFNANGAAGSLHRSFRVTFGYHFKVKPIKVLAPFKLSN